MRSEDQISNHVCLLWSKSLTFLETQPHYLQSEHHAIYSEPAVESTPVGANMASFHVPLAIIAVTSASAIS